VAAFPKKNLMPTHAVMLLPEVLRGRRGAKIARRASSLIALGSWAAEPPDGRPGMRAVSSGGIGFALGEVGSVSYCVGCGWSVT